eukprot:Nk52_evm22s265 gene=Nk52_evmTU22s265
MSGLKHYLESPSPLRCGKYRRRGVGHIVDSDSDPDEEACAKSDIENANTCPICLDVTNEQAKSSVSGCSHTFCFTCIQQWSFVAASCPLCKAPFKVIKHGSKVVRVRRGQSRIVGNPSGWENRDFLHYYYATENNLLDCENLDEYDLDDPFIDDSGLTNEELSTAAAGNIDQTIKNAELKDEVRSRANPANGIENNDTLRSKEPVVRKNVFLKKRDSTIKKFLEPLSSAGRPLDEAPAVHDLKVSAFISNVPTAQAHAGSKTRRHTESRECEKQPPDKPETFLSSDEEMRVLEEKRQERVSNYLCFILAFYVLRMFNNFQPKILYQQLQMQVIQEAKRIIHSDYVDGRISKQSFKNIVLNTSTAYMKLYSSNNNLSLEKREKSIIQRLCFFYSNN